MKKKELFLVLFLLMFFIFLKSTKAAIGVTPASFNVDFKPDLKEKYCFNFYTDEYADFEFFLEGDLGKYVNLERKKTEKGAIVCAYLSLPKKIDAPGRNVVYVGARQKRNEEDYESMGVMGGVMGSIFVNVPYPGQYAEISLSASDVNLGEDVPVNLNIKSLGEENIFAVSSFEIYDLNSTSLVEKIELEGILIKPGESKTIKKKITTKNYSAGEYTIKANVFYGGISVKREANFKIGRLFIDISNYTRVIKRGWIKRLDIFVKSYWNLDIDNVYADGIIPEAGFYFKTPSEKVKRWSEKKLSGYIEMYNISGNKFNVNLTVYYENEKTNKMATVEIAEKELIDYMPLILAITMVLTFIFIVLAFYTKREEAGKNELFKKT